jgi:hypothetical protein
VAKEKPLSLTEAERVLRHVETDPKKPIRRLLKGDDGKYLLEAIDKHKKVVYLPNMGKHFNITYPKNSKRVWVQSTEGFAPCAWITVETLRIEVRESVIV